MTLVKQNSSHHPKGNMFCVFDFLGDLFMKKVCLKLCLVLCLFSTLVGCATTEISFNQNSKKISTTKSIYVMLPKDGTYGTTTYDFSGNVVQRYLVKGFQKHSQVAVQAASSVTTLQKGLAEAKNQKIDLLVCPEITQWEDRFTAWSGIRDKVNINVRIIDVKSNKVLSTADLYGTGKSGMFSGNDKPDIIVPRLVDKYMESLY